MIKYYRVGPRKNPDGDGIVVKFEDGELEVIAGEGKKGFFLDKEGNFRVSSHYSKTEINEKKAEKLAKDSFYVKAMLDYCKPDHLITSNTIKQNLDLIQNRTE
ncbi:MAG: hypothetical protein KKF48_04970 [Nanoarchaeota archaeon]|nr:hypothetical protein [Nanoarchaeota archaeon]MBU1028369.1 hypothetical protein [Nanoarchaeota archaeon]